MKYAWNAINTVLILLLFMYIMITKDINSTAIEQCNKIEEQVSAQKTDIDQLFKLETQKDTIVINIRNYNYIKK